MEESVTYQEILRIGMAQGKLEGKLEGKAEGIAEGKLQEGRELILRLGKKRFGEPGAEIVDAVNRLTDPLEIEPLLDRLLEASGWRDLFPPKPPARRRSGR